MEVREAIYDRRAVRDYTPLPVPEEMVRKIIDAAIQAPSARHMQPWAFVVIQDRDLLKQLSRRVRWLLHAETHQDEPEFNHFYTAGTLILICANPIGYRPDWDCCLAAQNLMLAATDLGLSTCPIGSARAVFELEDVKEMLGIPGDFDPIMPIIVGYSAHDPDAPGREPPQILSWTKAPASV